MLVIADSSPLILLARIDCLELLQQLYGEIRVPEAVYEEIVEHGDGLPASEEVRSAEWIVAHEESGGDQKLLRALEGDLGYGEAQAIGLAAHLDADLLLIDEREGRQERLPKTFVQQPTSSKPLAKRHHAPELFGWLTPKEDFLLPDSNGYRPVQIERRHGRPTGWCPTNQLHTVPLEVIRPPLTARIKQIDCLSRFRVFDFPAGTFPERTRDAGKGQVPILRGATLSKRNYVVHVERRLLAFLGKAAVFAPSRGSFNRPASQLRWDRAHSWALPLAQAR